MGAAMIVMMSCSGTPAYAEEKGNAVTVETVTEGTETKTENETEEEEKNSREEEGILTSVPLDPSIVTRLTAGMDPDIVEVLLENPKLMALLMPTLHVTVTDSTAKIAFREQEPAEPVTIGTVRTNGGNLNVRAGASIDSAVISRLKNGTEVKVLGEKDGWYEIEIPSEYAWVCGKYLQVTRTTPQETEEGYTFDIDGEMMLGFLKLFHCDGKRLLAGCGGNQRIISVHDLTRALGGRHHDGITAGNNRILLCSACVFIHRFHQLIIGWM